MSEDMNQDFIWHDGDTGGPDETAPPETEDTAPRAKETFQPDSKDAVFALFAFALGYLFSRWVWGTWQGWGVAVFTTLYLASVSVYLMKKGARFDKAAWFWLAVTGLTGLSFALWTENELAFYRALFLFCSAVYWVLSATKRQIAGRTGDRLFLDGVNAALVIPFRNFGNQYKSVALFGRKEKSAQKKVFPVLLGIVLALIVMAAVIPLLIEADSGGFSRIVNSLLEYFSFETMTFVEFALYIVVAIPVAAYLFGLVSGCSSGKGTDAFRAESVDRAVESIRVLPPATVYAVLSMVSALYIVFISCQLPYFFSAFNGARPEGWMVYSEYARRGFFELCDIAALNLALLTAANLICQKRRSGSATLKILNVVLALLTLLLIATAFSKMALYIDVYGLTVRRILPCAFMVLLAVVCCAVIALQRWRFSVVRVSLVAGAVIFCLLALSDPDGTTVRYNTERYLSGTLSEYDVDVLYRAGSAGVLPALEVCGKTADEALKEEIRLYVEGQAHSIDRMEGTSEYNLQMYMAAKGIEGFAFDP